MCALIRPEKLVAVRPCSAFALPDCSKSDLGTWPMEVPETWPNEVPDLMVRNSSFKRWAKGLFGRAMAPQKIAPALTPLKEQLLWRS